MRSDAQERVLDACRAELERLPDSVRVCVAFSGGLDSTVLLDALHTLRDEYAFRLSALHVHHGLSVNADRWKEFCSAACATRNIPLQVERVHIHKQPGDSLEALARAERYRIFATADAHVIALAQHRDDQAETLLLQLLRGAGLRGLAAMPRVSRCGAIELARPLLDLPRTVLRDYAQLRQLEWIEDETNAVLEFDRNFLRQAVFPQIAARFPGYTKALARSAKHIAEAQGLLEALAEIDAGAPLDQPSLNCARLRDMSRERAANMLRAFLQSHGVVPPQSTRLAEALRQLREARHDANVLVDLGQHELRRYADYAFIISRRPAPPPGFKALWQGENELGLPELGGRLIFERISGSGLRGDIPTLEVRLRHGDARFQPDCRRPHRSLRNLFQEARIPPWQRGRLPLLYCGDMLVAIPGIGVACEWQVEPGEQGWRIEWIES